MSLPILAHLVRHKAAEPGDAAILTFVDVDRAGRFTEETRSYRQLWSRGQALARWLAAGSLPLWNADELAGVPLLGTGQAAVLYPPRILLFGLLGALDDWKKLTHRKGEGMSERQKLLGQLLIATAAMAPAAKMAIATAAARRTSPKATHTGRKAISPRVAPIAMPVRNSPPSKWPMPERVSDRPRTATASVCVPMASAR